MSKSSFASVAFVGITGRCFLPSFLQLVPPNTILAQRVSAYFPQANCGRPKKWHSLATKKMAQPADRKMAQPGDRKYFVRPKIPRRPLSLKIAFIPTFNSSASMPIKLTLLGWCAKKCSQVPQPLLPSQLGNLTNHITISSNY